jgi:hypothetical protein
MQCAGDSTPQTADQPHLGTQADRPNLGGHAHLIKTVDWDSPKGNISQFVGMSQDHMCYNMIVVSVEVRDIMDLDASADVLCPESGNILGQLSL